MALSNRLLAITYTEESNTEFNINDGSQQPGKKSKRKKNKKTQLQNNNEEMKLVSTSSDSEVLLDTFEKIIRFLKSDGDLFIPILQQLFEVAKVHKENKTKICQITRAFIGNLVDIREDSEELGSVSDKLKECFLPQELRPLFIPESELRVESAIIEAGSFGDTRIGFLKKEGTPEVKVAVKGSNSGFKYILEHEAKIMCKLDHKNIVKILGIQRKPFRIALDFISSVTVFSVLEAREMSSIGLLRILHDVTSGMEYLAQEQYVHRDLTTDSVFMHYKQCQIGDFQHCRYVGDTHGVYQDNEFNVTKYNVPPETERTKNFTLKSDIWAMGTFIWDVYYTSGDNYGGFFATYQRKYLLNRFQSFTRHSTWAIKCPLSLAVYTKDKILNNDPNRRPDFVLIKEKISQLLVVG